MGKINHCGNLLAHQSYPSLDHSKFVLQLPYFSNNLLWDWFLKYYNSFLFLVTLYGVFTIHFSPNVPSRCLLLELLDVSVSELLLYSSHQGCSMWMIQHCARDVLEALAFLHHEGYVHADLKPRNILWSAENECFKLIDFGLSFKEGNQVRSTLITGVLL